MAGVTLGDSLIGIEGALGKLRSDLAAFPAVSDTIFKHSEAWTELLSYKLVPHLGGGGCLVVAVTGGTNTGKSTVFNILAGHNTSPVRTTAAATCRSCLVANQRRCEEALAGKLVPEFTPVMLERAESIVQRESTPDTLYVTRQDDLPDDLVLLDTPDIDSIDKDNWTIAQHIRTAGDVLIAVLTGEKYKDERVVAFFRAAHASGRVILPLMNKANPANDFEIARTQLREFQQDVGLTENVSFAVAHDFKLAEDFSSQPIHRLDTEGALHQYIEALDIAAIKERVFRDSVAHFNDETQAFLAHAEKQGQYYQDTLKAFDSLTLGFAEQYDPAPGADIGGLFHEFVQSKRGPLDKAIGTASRTVVKGVSFLGKSVGNLVFKQSNLETPTEEPTADLLHAAHAKQLERYTLELNTALYEKAQVLESPFDILVNTRLNQLVQAQIVAAVTDATLQAENISDEFRAHAERMLEEWWQDNTGKRRIIEGLDKVLLLMPAAIAAPLSFYTAGVGTPEAIMVAGPIVEQFIARVVEYQFGDQMFNFLAPWRVEQQTSFHRALMTHVTHPVLAELDELVKTLNGDAMTELRRCMDQCQTAS